MLARLLILCVILATAAATDVKRCSGNKPFRLDVRIAGCDIPPCDVIKDTDIVFQIDFVVAAYITEITTLVKATTMMIAVPYELPKDVRDVCSHLMYGAYCPLYPTEDVTHLFVFPIGNYPEIGVKVEIYIVDQDRDIVTCFVCDIKVKKGPASSRNVTYEIDF